jgi:sec-independent protein translocase protein TatB
VFDIGPGEFIGLAILALIVLGPEKLPRYAADAAKMLRQVRRMASEARAEVTRELGPELKDLSLSDLSPRGMLSKHLLDPIDLDDLDDVGTKPKPVARRGPGESSAPTAPAAPPPYDEDAT